MRPTRILVAVLLVLFTLAVPVPPAEAQSALLSNPSAGPNAPGALVVGGSLSMEPSALRARLVVEQLRDGVWVPLPAEEVVVTLASGENPDRELAIRLRSGWPRGLRHRVRIDPGPAATSGESADPDSRKVRLLEWEVPAAGSEEAKRPPEVTLTRVAAEAAPPRTLPPRATPPAPARRAVAYEKVTPREHDSAKAAAEAVGGRFPGG